MKKNKILNPKTIALIGATDRPGSVGLSLCNNLLTGNKNRKIFFVNPFRKKVLNKKTYSSIGVIKEGIDLVVIAVPSRFVLGVLFAETIVKENGCAIIIPHEFC